MRPIRAQTFVRTLLLSTGGIAIGTAGAVIAKGTRAIPGGGSVSPTADSVLRFYATWWGGSGVAMLAAAAEPYPPPTLVRSIAATTFLGGLARLGASRHSGPPHPLFQILTIVELLTPPILIITQRSAMRDSSPVDPRRPGGT
ncbi:DUF4345 domain-containing protein [Pseudonocardia alni]|uniref:DUF4345 domain-containing protein n=1 Tax=Pseudonocardia alni TaxID=33907 RepID=UPI00357132EE